MSHQSVKNREIEFLRALAISMVVFHHRGALIFWPCQTSKWLAFRTACWSGVDLFFVISGFVISLSLVPHLQGSLNRSERVQNVVQFFVRRIFRLWPSAWLWVVIVLIASYLSNVSGAWTTFELNFKSAFAALGQYYNFWEYYCNHHGGCSANAVYWSLSLEEQFYFLYPFFIVLTGRYMLPTALVGIAAQLFLKREVWSFIWAIRTDTILLGVAIYLGRRRGLLTKIERLYNHSASINYGFASLVVAILVVIGSDWMAWPRATGCIAVLSALLVLPASFNKGYLCPKGSYLRVTDWLGSRSFAIYLVHSPLFRAVHEIFYRYNSGDPNTLL